MQFQFRNHLRSKLKAGGVTYGMLVTLESASISEVAADLGLDWILIDMEHGSLSFRDVVNHIRATRGSDISIIVKVASATVENIKKSLDLGAHCVFVPLVRTADDLREAFKHARYPMLGERGLGGERQVHWGLATKEYVSVADEETMVAPIIETVESIRNMDAILSVPGVEAIFYGLGDLAQTMGHRGTWDGPGVAEAVAKTVDMAKKRGVATGVLCRDATEMKARIEQGFQMIGVGTDIRLLMNQVRDLLHQTRQP